MTTLNGRPGKPPRPQTPPPCPASAEATTHQKAADLGRIVKAGWSVPEFCFGAGIGRSKAYEMMNAGLVSFVIIGRRRIITTSPADFLARAAGKVEG